jgi:hypothetical protein
MESFGRLNQERRRMCVHADLPKARHEQDPLGILMPFEEFIAADYFLFLKGELTPEWIADLHRLETMEHAVYELRAPLSPRCQAHRDRAENRSSSRRS